MLISCKLARLPNVEGMPPVNSLVCKVRCVNPDRLPNDDGKVPVRLRFGNSIFVTRLGVPATVMPSQDVIARP